MIGGSGTIIHTKFYKDWVKRSKADREDTQTHRQHGDGISLLLFFKNKKSRLKITPKFIF
jgi:hypothetical protein